MNEATLNLLIQMGGLAVATLADYLREAPADAAEAKRQDRAVMALMEHVGEAGRAVRARQAAGGTFQARPLSAVPAPPATDDDDVA